MLNESNLEPRVIEISKALQAEGSKCVLVAAGISTPNCSCGRPECVGAIALQFAGSKSHLLEIAGKILSNALNPDELAAFGRSLIEHAYNLQSPANAPMHRRRFRGGVQN